MMRSLPRNASSATGRSKPWVSDIRPTSAAPLPRVRITCRHLALHQQLVRLDAMFRVLRRRSTGEAEALEQPKRTLIWTLQDSRNAAHVIVIDELGDHRLDRLTRESATPISAA